VPIILVRTEGGSVLPVIKRSNNYSCLVANTRLEKKTFGKFKGKALKQAFKIIRDKVRLNISGEYGSLEISDKDFILSEQKLEYSA
jgi:hypothetical protein